MLQLILNFEHSSGLLDQTVLLSIGIIAFAAGLVMWLAGCALRRLFLFAGCATAGAIVGLYFVGRKAASAVGLASLFGIVAALLDKFFVTILSAALAVVIAMTVMAWHYEAAVFTELPIEHPSISLSPDQTLEFISKNLANLVTRAEDSCRQMPSFNWLTFPVLIVLFIAGGLYFWNIICAWFWATIGAMLIFTGMVSLLLYKGSFPITYIFHNGPYFVTVFLAMMTLGTIVQLMLFHNIKTEGLKEKTKSGSSQEPSKKQGWRGL